MFSNTTTELSINRESASASPPRTMLLTEDPFICSPMKGASTETGLVEHPRRPHLRGHVDQVLEGAANSRHDRDGVGITSLLQYRQIHGALPVDVHYVVLQGVRIFQFTDI